MDLVQYTVGQRLTLLRHIAGWRRGADINQAEAAKAAGIARQQYSEIENGRRGPTPDQMEALAELYEVPIEVLTEEAPLPEPHARSLVRAAERLEQEAARLRAEAAVGRTGEGDDPADPAPPVGSVEPTDREKSAG